MPATIVEPGESDFDPTPTGSHTMALPVEQQVGDLLLLWVGTRGTTAGPLTIDRPTGWTRLGTTQSYSWSLTGRTGGALFYKIADGTSSVTVTYGTGWTTMAMGCTVARGVTGSIFTGSVGEWVGGTGAPAPDPLPTQRAIIIAHYSRNNLNLSPGGGWENVAWDTYNGSLAIGAVYQAVEPGSYTMPNMNNVVATVAIIDTPAGGIYVGMPIGGAGLVVSN